MYGINPDIPQDVWLTVSCNLAVVIMWMYVKLYNDNNGAFGW